ncbi:MAG TPA: efflux RND transporter permease subunit [Thermoanaerobaculia bacterium]|nr:efflux RND transporter permease subunit [Thermoanaerobaculia bacterium]HUM28605.1 efflux RND transporter permease subunit [Thermoanaerobaculia bacterium]HXK66787.1 efflux RND transporter permease subunit [Thermoanaerobaculia bacterium]
MNIVDSYLRKPHLLTSLVLLAAVIGLVGYRQMPVNLFPDSERPQIAVVTVYPGASATDVEADVSRTIEKELNTLEQVRRVTSVSKDEVSAVMVEFEYSKGLDSAATDVANGLEKIRAGLPQAIRPPMIFKVSSATPAVLTLALRPKDGSPLDLSMVRQIAENQIKERLLQLPEVSNVEVFGAHQPVVRIELDRDKLEHFGLTPPAVREHLMALNANQPVGLFITSDSQFLLKRTGEFQSLSEIGSITIAHLPGGDIHLADIATIHRGTLEPQSAYHGDGKPAIAVNVQRSTSGNTLQTIAGMGTVIPDLEATYPGLEITIPDTQGTLIELSVGNMLNALRDAVIMTILVIFLFLADLRSMILAAISIPFTYLLTFAVMWIFGFEFNMVTLTAVIIAVGMLLDDAIVVLENIERHYHESGTDIHQAVVGGTQEVMLAIFSGTYATIMVLLPIIFIGGFVQTVLRPLSITLSIALLASYLVSVTVIPLLAPALLRRGEGKGRNRFELLVYRFNEKVIDPIRDFYVRLTSIALSHRALFLILGLALLAVSARQMPLIGRDLMPPMDTGIIKINFEADSNTSLEQTERVMSRMEEIIFSRPEVNSVSSLIGSEPAVISFGAGRLPQQGNITVHLTDRFQRSASIWDIEKDLHTRFQEIPGLRSVDVFDFGATPLSTIRASVDVMVSGPDLKTLDAIGKDVEARLRAHLRGATSVTRSWTMDSEEITFIADPEKLALYQVSPTSVLGQVAGAVRGMPSSTFRVPNQDGLAIWVQLPREQRQDVTELETYPVSTPVGRIPLVQLGRFEHRPVASVITRQGLQRTLDIQAYRSRQPISHLQEDVETALTGLNLPSGYRISHEGEIKQMNESFARLGKALVLGLILLYFSLVPAFKSWIHPLTIMSAIPLALIGASWGMLIAGKHGCMPSMMGMILLAGIVVKNSILLIDFIAAARERGETSVDALIGSVRVRTRPILMTAVGTSVGMIPIAMEWAIGLERLSPLAIVAIGGLMVSTFLTMVYVPILYSLFEDLQSWTGSLIRRIRPQEQGA